MRSMSLSTALVAVATVVSGLAAVVYLTAQGQDAAPALSVIAPVLATLFVANKMDSQSATLDNVNGRLNGELDKRIAAAVRVALTADRDDRAEVPPTS